MSQEHIQIIEDELEIAELIRDYLEDEGFSVTISLDGQAGLEAFKETDPDLVILDLMLPKMDGFEVCRLIRKDSEIPVLILSSKNTDMDKVLALGIGADDYVTKPFSPVELIARIKAHLRRQNKSTPSSVGTSSHVLLFKNLKIDLAAYTVTVDGNTVSMTNKEFELLKLLAQNPNQVLTKDQIISAVWGNNYYGDDNTIPVHIRKIREKIEKDPGKPEFILTVWGVGYRFTGGKSYE
jgi:DNA-binding response OmpR family regulator